MTAPGPSAQFKAIDLANAFHNRDAEYLDSIGPDRRAEQERIREGLYMYADQLWDVIKARARRDHGSGYNTAADPAYAGVAGMRDLASELLATVQDAMARAGDDEPGGLNPWEQSAASPAAPVTSLLPRHVLPAGSRCGRATPGPAPTLRTIRPDRARRTSLGHGAYQR